MRKATKDGYCWQHHPDAANNIIKQSVVSGIGAEISNFPKTKSE
jgi:hypothetical protein